MSQNRLSEEKNNKMFKKADLFVYGFILALIISLFIGFVFSNSSKDIDVVEFYQKDDKIIEYSFKLDSLNIISNGENIDVLKENGNYYITIKDGERFNFLEIDTKAKKVVVKETNCSKSKDCTHMSIKKEGDVIVCVPNKLNIKVKTKYVQKPITG